VPQAFVSQAVLLAVLFVLVAPFRPAPFISPAVVWLPVHSDYPDVDFTMTVVLGRLSVGPAEICITTR
jgi:hypothetical protein